MKTANNGRINFIEGNSKIPFSWHRTLNEKECLKAYKKATKRIKISNKKDMLDIIQQIVDNGIYLSAYNAGDNYFSLSKVLTDLKIQQPVTVFINWHRFDDIDQMFFRFRQIL